LLQQWPNGLPHSQHRPTRHGGDALRRRVRRAKLHRGALVVHHRTELRTGLSKVGIPASPIGLHAEDPTIAELLKPLGYATGQFGKNHLGDLNKYLPTAHGFDEFYGNLYHLNAEEEPERANYPSERDFPEYRKQFGPRGVIHSWATDKDDATEEPRWGLWARTAYATRSVFVAPRRNGRMAPAWARYFGAIGSNLVANTWLPPSSTTTSQNLRRIGNGFLGRFVGNMWQEFLPDVRRRFNRNADARPKH
jgi:hypothetical protein